MKDFARPRILFSRCLGFEACRYDGSVIHDEFVAALLPHVDCLTSCPEVGAGLGVPRESVRLVREGGKLLLLQPASGKDWSGAMEGWCAREVAGLAAGPAFDGIILKSRSPSCGPGDVKVYAGREARSASDKGSGFFATALSAAFPGLPMEDEGRTRNFSLREHFLIALYCRAEYREARATGDVRALLDLHSRWKLLFMAYSPSKARVLGRILAANRRVAALAIFEDYGRELSALFSRPFRYTAMINALQHAFGGLSERLSPPERSYFLATLEEYRDERVPLSVPLRILKGWAIAQANGYLLDQRLLGPYPLGLVTISDSGKGRDL
jgi:uncharacterized protein YbgA (DUF1722 family)/uncharacterized protein YbbK (DUF523 family)